MSDEDLIKSFSQDVNEVTKEEVESNVKEQISEDIFENLPKNIQEAIKLKMSLEDDLKLDEIDLETVQSGDIEEIKKMLEESNIIGKKDETGKIKYEKRVQNNDLLEDANNVFKSMNEAFREFDGTPGSRETKNNSMIENNIKNRDLTKVERNEKIIITNNNQKVNTIQKGKSKEEKITLNTDSVNNNNFLRDLNLQKIKE